MNEMSRTLIARSQPPDMIHLRQIKCHFKQNGQLIYHVNTCFNLVMSVVVVFAFIWEELYLSFNLIATYFAYLGTLSKHQQDGYTQQELMRCLSAEALLILMKLSLIGITITQMFAVNHESRMAEIVINDQMSQLDRTVDRDLYTAVSSLK